MHELLLCRKKKKNMFRIDHENMPFLRTGAALLVLDIQNDIVGDHGVLQVTQPAHFMGNIANLVHVFRSRGQVMWILTHFEAHRAVNDPSVDAESVITDQELPVNAWKAKQRERRRASLQATRARMLHATGQDGGDEGPENDEKDEEEEMGAGKDDANETYLTLSPGRTPKCCMPGSLGSNLHDSLQQGNTYVFDQQRDLVIGKTHYSAFKSGALVEKLRSSMTTEIYICGALTNISIYATVLDAVRHGYSITIISDSCGYRSRERHNEAVRRMTESMGCETMTSVQLIEVIRGRDKRDPRERDQKGQGKSSVGKSSTTDLEQLMDKLELRGGATLDFSDSEGLTLPPKLPASYGTIKPRVKAKTSMRRRSSTSKTHSRYELAPQPSTSERSSLPEPADPPEPGATQDDAETKALPGHSTFCEGDSEIITHIFPAPLADSFFQTLCSEVVWQRMSHQGGDVPRLIAVQGLVYPDGTQPVYRHPSDESPPLCAFSETVRRIRPYVEKALGHDVNHVLIQFYRDGTHHITEHSDKTLDIVPGTFIANVSLGAERSMTFRTKKSDADSRTIHKETLPHNSLCKFGLKSNAVWLHAIRPDRRDPTEKPPEVLAFNGSRISLTFRKIGTFLNRNQILIWGQGAVAKEEKDARKVSRDAGDARAMLRAFGNENRLGQEFDQAAEYGRGFDVVHVSNERKLILGGLDIQDARIRILLEALDIDVTICAEHDLTRPIRLDASGCPLPPPDTPRQSITFIDNDVPRTRLEGDLAIALYLDRVYADGKLTSGATFDTGKCYTRLVRLAAAVAPADLPYEMRRWEVSVAEHGGEGYVAGAEMCLADYFLWPLLHSRRGTLQGEKEVLAGYYGRIGARRGFRRVLEGAGIDGDAGPDRDAVPDGETVPEANAVPDSTVKHKLRE